MPSCSWWSTMNDNQLSALVRQQLLLAVPPGTEVIQGYQPTHQGRPGGMSLGFFHVDEQRHGSAIVTDEYEEGTGDFLHTERQWVITRMQCWALSPQDPKDTSRPTSKDLAQLAASWLVSDRVRVNLRAAGVGVQRVLQVRNPYFTNDRDENEASPSFDFLLSWQRSIVSRTPAAQSVEFKIHRV